MGVAGERQFGVRRTRFPEARLARILMLHPSRHAHVGHRSRGREKHDLGLNASKDLLLLRVPPLACASMQA